MDAEYSFSIAREIAGGRGLVEPFLWNYLDDPRGPPHPSHLYWMPLPSLIAALPMSLAAPSFRWAQAAFVLLSAALPLLTLYSARTLQLGRHLVDKGALLSLVPGFYLAYFLTTDSFTPYAVFGSLALLLAARAVEEPNLWRWLLLGVVCGLGHLTRADGFLLLLPAVYAAYLARRQQVRSLSLVAVGYFLIMLLWWARNLSVAGTLLSPGGLRTFWALGYDELYIYPASLLTPARWWSSGISAILSARLQAVGANLWSLVAVNGLIFLGPLMAVGAWILRGRPLVRLTVLYLAVAFLVMSLVFPFAGPRGGFFHSSAALMPILWALAPVGLEWVVSWLSRRRRWRDGQAFPVLFGGAFALACVVTGLVFVRRVVGEVSGGWEWERSYQVYQQVGQALRQLDPDPGLVAVNNPPGFYLATGLSSVVIPDGTPEALEQVILRYGVEWVILEANHPAGLRQLYQDPARDPSFVAEGSRDDAHGKVIWFLRWRPPTTTE
jgi:hypothetical protein